MSKNDDDKHSNGATLSSTITDSSETCSNNSVNFIISFNSRHHNKTSVDTATSSAADSYAIILHNQQRVKRLARNSSHKSKTTRNCCLQLFIFFYYVKYYANKLKICFLVLLFFIFFVILSCILLIGALNFHYCFHANDCISFYLIVFSITCITRLVLYVSCPFSYDKCKMCIQNVRPSKRAKCSNCCSRAKREFYEVTNTFKDRKNKNQFGAKSKLPKFSGNSHSRPSLLLLTTNNSAINFISHKFSETVEGNQRNNKWSKMFKKKSSTTDNLIRNHHHRPNEYRHLERYNTKYKFIDCDSIRYGIAICLQRTLDLFLLCWFIYGNYAVFSLVEYSENLSSTSILNKTTKTTLTIKANMRKKEDFFPFLDSTRGVREFCSTLSSYKVALFKIIVLYTIFAFLIIFYIFLSACKLVYGVLKKHNKPKNNFDNNYV